MHGDELVKVLLKLTKSDDERVRLGAIQTALRTAKGRVTRPNYLSGAVSESLNH